MKYTGIALAGTVLLIFALFTAGCAEQAKAVQTGTQETIKITDGFGRTVEVTVPPQKVICSNVGSLRYLVYLQAQDKVVAVDSIEKKVNQNDARGYALANPQFMSLPLFGEYRGKDDPEKIIAIAPDLIFKSSFSNTPAATNKENLDELQRKTKIPVVGFSIGGLRTESEKNELCLAFNLMGSIMGKDERAKEVIEYINATIEDLEKRTKDIPEASRRSVYIGGVALAGPHGLLSSEPAYPPFEWVNAKNIATQFGTEHADIAKEYITATDPEYIFVDLSTIQDTSGGSAIDQLKNDPAFKGLTAAKNGNVYGVLPYNWYATNIENMLADAYFIGKIVYPDQFADIDPVQKAEEITAFFDGMPLMDQYQKNFDDLVFKQISL